MEIMCTFTLSIRHKTNFKNRENDTLQNFRQTMSI
jgi:hypothetical protein